jgi:hypothetical protein
MNWPHPPFPAMEMRVFNDDLLSNAGDLRYAKEQFEKIFPILDYVELRSAFINYERRAHGAKAWVHRLGLVAVFFGTVALLSAATEPLWADASYSRVFVIIFEMGGLVAAFIASGGTWLGPWKRQWLESRFMTERLRQWHFQLLIRRGQEIESAFENDVSNSLQKFQTQRKSWLNDFLHDHKGKIDSRMESFAHDPDFSNDWLHPATAFKNDSSILALIFDAYRQLRLLHQYDYITHKLSLAKDSAFWEFLRWPLLRQEALIGGAASFCFVAALLFAGGVIANRFFRIEPALDSVLESVTLVIAIIAVALRTIQDGLGVTNDIERYRNYRGKIRRALLHFDTTRDPQTKLRLMEELELAAIDELRGFLRSHYDARFFV